MLYNKLVSNPFLSGLTILAIGVYCGFVGEGVVSPILNIFFANIDLKTHSSLTTALLILVPVLCLLLYLLYKDRKAIQEKLKSKYTPGLGLYWDKERNAFCQCGSILGFARDVTGHEGFNCPNCKRIIFPINEKGERIGPHEAIQKMKAKLL